MPIIGLGDKENVELLHNIYCSVVLKKNSIMKFSGRYMELEKKYNPERGNLVLER